MNRSIRVAHVATVDLTVRFLLLDQLRRLREEGFEVVAISAPGPWRDAIEAEGIRCLPWRHATRAWSPLADLLAMVELFHIFRRESPDIVHTHNPKPGILGRIAARAAGVPCVVNTVHGLYATPDDPPTKRSAVLVAEGVAARFSDLELYQSEEDLRWARAVGIVSRRRSVLLSNGTDLARFSPSTIPKAHSAAVRRELSIPVDAPVVGMVGRLVAEKGFREFFGAARIVRRARPDVHFVAVGTPDLEKADAIGEREMSQASREVIFTGWHEDVRPLLSAMDVFVLPSWREGVPRSAIEAAAMGKAMVLSNVRGCREVAREGEEALFVPPKDPERLADAITLLVSDPGLRDRLGRAARRRALERFDATRVHELILAAYRTVLTKKGLSAPKLRRVGV